MSLFSARETNQFNTFLSSLEVEDGPSSSSEWAEPMNGGGRGQGHPLSDRDPYSHPPPLSPSHQSHQHNPSRFHNGTPASAHAGPSSPSQRNGRPSGASSPPRSSLPWPQPQTSHATSPTRQQPQASSSRHRARGGSGEWTDHQIEYRPVPTRPGIDIDHPARPAHRPHPRTNGHTLDPAELSISPPGPSSLGRAPASSSSQPTVLHPGLPRLSGPPAGPSSSVAHPQPPSRSIVPSQTRPHPHLDRPGNSTRVHPTQPPAAAAPAETFTAPPLPNLRAKSPVAPALLTASQKKANHIASEQKRRANIRRGYDALCETVPSLREAARQEALKASSSSAATSGRRGSRARKKVEGSAAPEGSAGGAGDKTDGRSGPKSEGIVLVKTIEHLRELLDSRQALLGRLDYLRSKAAQMYPTSQHGQIGIAARSAWEAEWEGGADEEGSEDGSGGGDD